MTDAPPGGRAAFRARRMLLILLGLYAAFQLAFIQHGRLRHWDEVYHFKVATTLLENPLAPRLRVDPIRPVSAVDWWNSEVWLHKPILPFWVSAASMKVFGLSVWAFRLPSVLLGCLCIWLTFLLGRRAVSERTGLFAAFLFASSAFAFDVVQGVQFGDITDVHLAAWNTLAVYLLVRAVLEDRGKLWALSGVAVGLAILSKSFLALAPLCLGPVAWALSALGRFEGVPRVKPGRVAAQWGAALLVCGPVLLYLGLRFPEQFRHSFFYGLHHLDKAIEPVWVHGPDWTWNEMLQRELREPFALFGAVAIAAFSVSQAFSREPARALTAVWLGATMFMLSIVRMKAPGQLFGAFPAALIAIAWLLRRGFARPSPLIAGLFVGLLAQLITFAPATWPDHSGPLWPDVRPILALLPRGLPDLLQHPESVRGLVLLASATFAVLLLERLAHRLWRPPLGVPGVRFALGLSVFLLFLLGWTGFFQKSARELELHWMRSWSQRAADAIAQHGPKRAAVFIDGAAIDDRLDLELEAFSHQSALSIEGLPGAEDLELARAQGRAPLLVSARRFPFATLQQDPARKRLEVYDLSRPAAPPDLASFGLEGAPRAGGGFTILGAAIEADPPPRRGGTALLAVCLKLEQPQRWARLHLAAIQDGIRIAFERFEPLAYGLLDGRLGAGDIVCQRAAFDVPMSAPKGPLDLWLGVGDLRPIPSGAALVLR